MIKRIKTRVVKIGKVKIGGNFPISIQSMAKTDTADAAATVKQIKALRHAGCEVVRVAVKDLRSALTLARIKSRIKIPLEADIHFNYKLALAAAAAGADAIRLNPGNIYHREEVKQVAAACKKRGIPIRVGVNSGSLPPTSYLLPTKLADSMVKSALDYIKLLESFNFRDIIISLKAADICATVDAYSKMARACPYPFHLGVTATGLPEQGAIKSALGIGSLLLRGIGDTIRVSLAGDPVEEVRVAKQILQSLGLRNFGPELIVCPTCGRCQMNVVKIAQDVDKRLNQLLITNYHLSITKLKIAIMGCEVNGPGEAKQADLGVACGKGSAVLFKRGRIVRRVKESKIMDTIINEVIRKLGD